MLGEIGFISILFFPRGRLFFIFSMIFLHVLTYFGMGINFLGSSIILILCFDWNAIIRKSSVYYDADCAFCTKSINVVNKFDYFEKVSFLPMQSLSDGEFGFSLERLKKEMGCVEADGKIFYGARAFEKVFEKIPLFYPVALLYKIPFIIYIAEIIYSKIAANRYLLSDSDACKVDYK